MTYINQLAKAGYRITGTWAEHIARGSLGGLDYNTPVGTPLKAPSDCYIINTPNNGTGGHTVTMYFANGTRDQYMHLSRFVTPGKYAQGATVGYSGGAIGSAGAGASTGPHCHWHKILANGTRVNPLNYVTAPAATRPPTQEEDDEMKTIQIHWTRAADKKLIRAMMTPGTAYFMDWTEGSPPTIANGLATQLTGSSIAVTESWAEKARTVAAKLEVTA